MPTRSSSPLVITLVVSLCGIAVSLTQTMIIPLVSILPDILHADAADASWAITVTLLVGAVTTPIGGRFGDMFGKRRMLLVSLGALFLGSAVSAMADSLAPMVVGRGLQGASIMAVPLGISILRDELPEERVGTGIAFVSASLGFGGALGLPLSAVIVEKANWHALFYVTGGAAALCAVAILLLVNESPVRTRGRIDVPGALGLAVGLTALLLAISKGGDWGWGGPITLGLLALSVVVFGLWTVHQLHTRDPMVDLRVSARPQVLFTNIVSLLMAFAMYGMSLIPVQVFMAPEETGYGLGLTILEAGLLMAPGGLVMLVASPLGARLSAIRSPRTTVAVASLIITVGYVIFLFLRTEPWQVVMVTMLISAGVGMGYAALPALIMGAVPVTETGAANGLNALMRSVGTSLSAAVIGVVLAEMTLDLGGRSLPTNDGFTVVILISLVASIASLAMTFFIPRNRVHQDPSEWDGHVENASTTNPA